MTFRGDLEALILAILIDGPKHGYEISKNIKTLSNKALNFGEGQLYPTLHKLEEASLIEANWIPQDGKPPRKVYALTETGRTQLTKKKQEWAKFQSSISAILGPTPATEANHG